MRRVRPAACALRCVILAWLLVLQAPGVVASPLWRAAPSEVPSESDTLGPQRSEPLPAARLTEMPAGGRGVAAGETRSGPTPAYLELLVWIPSPTIASLRAAAVHLPEAPEVGPGRQARGPPPLVA